MKRESLTIHGVLIPVIRAGVIIVGSGAASLNAAVHLKRFGVDDTVVITENLGGGVSANAGSDKQTYYRMNPGLPDGDAVLAMARDLFAGGCMHGDIALAEAALSLRGFYHLVEMGVPFPHDEYGIYPGYRTDHDPKGRGISAGPGTSIMMFEKLLEEARRLNIDIVDGLQAIELITAGRGEHKRIIGLAAIDRNTSGLTAVMSDNIVLGTGGPGGLFADSAYPHSQRGSLGMAIRAGAMVQNLTESQFGIASKGFRWNLSGSYQQALPRYVSTAMDGSDEREFLDNYFPAFSIMLDAQFLKGYEWPFNVRRINGRGSSCVDLLVYRETAVSSRRVFLDYRRNPSFHGVQFSPDNVPLTARDFLEKSSAMKDTPLQRLAALNPPAVKLFRDHGIDLAGDMLEISLCHQHLNGGLTGSPWWESNIRGLFPVGESNGSHGIYRPGGSALNSGQVGALRAAQCIAHRVLSRDAGNCDESGEFESRLERTLSRIGTIMASPPTVDLAEERARIQRRMSSTMGIIRSMEGVSRAIEENVAMMWAHGVCGIADVSQLLMYLENEDMLVAEKTILASARLLLDNLSGGRGSFIIGSESVIFDKPDGGAGIDLPEDDLSGSILQADMDESGDVSTRFVPVRPIPDPPLWFETVWAHFRAKDFMPR